MTTYTTSRPKERWGRKARWNLLGTWNCSESTVQAAQEMMSKHNDALIKASAGLEGGVVSCGSTCGVVSGGALSLALMHEKDLRRGSVESEMGLVRAVGDYVNWYRSTYGTTLCRATVGLDFWTLGGFFRYLVPPDRILRCLSRINGAMHYLYDAQADDLPPVEMAGTEASAHPTHCARKVLAEVRSRTGIGDPLLEKVSIAFDGGIGLQGGACGALTGAVMAINLPMGINLRDASVPRATIAIFRGHLLRDRSGERVDDPYPVGKRIVDSFLREAGSIECAAITGETFSDWASFQCYINSSDVCRRLMDLAADEATSAIEQYQSVH
jgi:hypothetical protein